MNKKIFNLETDISPSGDQPKAISQLIDGLNENKKSQILLGVTGSGKTFTMANVIYETNRPALIMAPNKILAAQLYNEMKTLFPTNHVEYFVSYYDYYQPEAYVPVSDTYIDKDASINEELDRMRHSATRAMIEEKDVIVVSSVSSIYGIGDPASYLSLKKEFIINQNISINVFIDYLVSVQYSRNDIDFQRGTFRLRGDILDIYPSHYENKAWRIIFFEDEIEQMFEFDTLTNVKIKTLDKLTIYPNTHFVTEKIKINNIINMIEEDLEERLKYFNKNNKFIEEQRLKERVNFDLEMIKTTGSCRGIENYSRYLSNRKEGEPPATLFDYLPKNALLFIDESHITIPQISAMSRGDRIRKETLSNYGFRLPSCIDNRPLTFEEWNSIRPQTIFVSATPGDFEFKETNGIIIEQIIRPTGLLDPLCEVRPTKYQIDDLLAEIKKILPERVLITTLTKKMSEQLTDFLNENNIKTEYLHSDVKTLERIKLLKDLRLGKYNVLVGINLLREGLDIPECRLVAIMDADKEGFLRSKKSLIQTIGRAARNINGYVIMYADNITKAMEEALNETKIRREKQNLYNLNNKIIPKTIEKKIQDEIDLVNNSYINSKELSKEIKSLNKQMRIYAENLEFEKALELRDRIKKLNEYLLKAE